MDYITNPWYDWIKVPQNMTELNWSEQVEIYKTFQFFFRRPVETKEECEWVIREAFMYRFKNDMAIYKPPVKEHL